MDWTNWLQYTLSAVAGAATIMFGYAAVQAARGYREQGKSQAKIDESNDKLNTNALLKEQIDALEKKVNTQSSDMEKMSKEIHELRLAVEAKDKKITEFMEIFQGRDPQMATFMASVTKYIESNIPLLEHIKMQSVPALDRLEKFLDKQTF